jgi:hypothetical protein
MDCFNETQCSKIIKHLQECPLFDNHMGLSETIHRSYGHVNNVDRENDRESSNLDDFHKFYSNPNAGVDDSVPCIHLWDCGLLVAGQLLFRAFKVTFSSLWSERTLGTVTFEKPKDVNYQLYVYIPLYTYLLIITRLIIYPRIYLSMNLHSTYQPKKKSQDCFSRMIVR